jgi:hypothetical protein
LSVQVSHTLLGTCPNKTKVVLLDCKCLKFCRKDALNDPFSIPDLLVLLKSFWLFDRKALLVNLLKICFVSQSKHLRPLRMHTTMSSSRVTCQTHNTEEYVMKVCHSPRVKASVDHVKAFTRSMKCLEQSKKKAFTQPTYPWGGHEGTSHFF